MHCFSELGFVFATYRYPNLDLLIEYTLIWQLFVQDYSREPIPER